MATTAEPDRVSRTRARSGAGTALRVLLALGLLTAALVGHTYARWTAEAPVPGLTLTSGTLDLTVNGQDVVTTTALSLSAAVPGSSTAQVLTVRNPGDVPLLWHLDARATDSLGAGLGDALVVTVTNAATVTGSGGQQTCGGVVLAGSGDRLTDGLLGSAGSPRAMAAGAAETFCLQVRLPLDAPASLLGTATDVRLDLEAVPAPRAAA